MRIVNVLLIAFFISVSSVYCQQSSNLTFKEGAFYQAKELYNNGQYGEAQMRFEEILLSNNDVHNQYSVESQFYSALCAIRLFNDDADKLITSFVYKYPESKMVNRAYFEMAMFRYRQKNFADANKWFSKVNKKSLYNSDKYDYYFKYGYSLFMENEYEKAKMMFVEIKDVDNEYSSPAKYYYAHIAYSEGNYQTALESFNKLEDDESFSPLVPYYKAHIFYLQKDYDKVIEYVAQSLEDYSVKRAAEMSRIVAEAYYQKKEYNNAVPFIEKFMKESKAVKRNDYFLSGYIYYRSDNLDKAIESFEKVVVEEDSLAQNSYYSLADCYLKQNDKSKALTAFHRAAALDFDKKIKEEAMFFAAKLSYELNYTPFNQSIEALENYINLFPDSPRVSEAYELMVAAFMNTKNYQKAYDVIKNLPLKDHRIKAAYQRTTYYRGIELFNNLDFAGAIEFFNKSLSVPGFDTNIRANTFYWRGEGYYRLEDYAKSKADFQDFLITSGAYSISEFDMAYYNIGYCFFKEGNHNKAIEWFRKYMERPMASKHKYYGDACNRTGDSYFLLRTYWMAIEMYDKCINANGYDKDYALYQKSFALGLVSRPEKKISTLNQLITEFPESSFIDDALFEKGNVLMSMGNNADAIGCYSQIVEKYQGSSSFYKKALVQLGLLNYNIGENQKALGFYKQVVSNFKGSPESRYALTGIKNIYVELNRVDEYVKFVENLGEFANITIAERDSLTYSAAEKKYFDGDNKEAQKSFETYIEGFSDGSFIVNSKFYLAQLYQQNELTDSALNYYEFVAKSGNPDFCNRALLETASIYYNQENYQTALSYYSDLENKAELKNQLNIARIGMMNCNYNLKDREASIVSADKVIHSEKIMPEDIRNAHYIKAISFIELGEEQNAIDEYTWLGKDISNAQGAESRYRIAEIYFNNNLLDISEKEVMDFAKQNTPHQFWLAKSFILLADIYLARDDAFQAKATLQSVIDGYSINDDGILDTANSKLLEIIKEEKSKLDKQENNIELHFDNDNKNEIEKLVNEPVVVDSLTVKQKIEEENISTQTIK